MTEHHVITTNHAYRTICAAVLNKSEIFAIVVQSRYEHWTGLGLDWIRTMTNFADAGLDPDINLGSGPVLN